MPDVIVTDRLTKYYGPQCAVDQLNLRVPQGAVYGLLGRDGAGKTTAIKMLLDMAQPSFGRAEVLGEERPAAARKPWTNRLSGRKPRVSLDDRRPSGQLHPLVYGDRWNQPLLDQILDHFELGRKRRIRRFARGGRSGVGAGRGHRPGIADSRRSHVGPRHGRAPRFNR